MANDFLQNETLSSAGTTTSSVFNFRYQNGVLTIEAAAALTAKLQRLNGMSSNWTDVTDNSGNVVTFTKNGTYTVSNPNKMSQYRAVVTAGSGNFSFEQ